MKTNIDNTTERAISRFLKFRRILNILIIITIVAVVHSLMNGKLSSTDSIVLISLVILQGLNYALVRPSITYDIADNIQYNQLNDAISALKPCNKIWYSNSGYKMEASTFDFKKPDLLKTNIECYKLNARGLRPKVYFLPDKLVIVKGTKSAFLNYTDIVFAKGHTTGNIETSDAKIYSQEWEHPKKDGSPDKRYKVNRLFTTYIYGVVSLEYSGSDLFHIIFSDVDMADTFISKLRKAKFKTH